MEEIIDILAAIESLNNRLFEGYYESYGLNFCLNTNLYSHIVSFGELEIWSSEDGRTEDASGNYISFEAEFTNRFNKIVVNLNKIRL